MAPRKNTENTEKKPVRSSTRLREKAALKDSAQVNAQQAQKAKSKVQAASSKAKAPVPLVNPQADDGPLRGSTEVPETDKTIAWVSPLSDALCDAGFARRMPLPSSILYPSAVGDLSHVYPFLLTAWGASTVSGYREEHRLAPSFPMDAAICAEANTMQPNPGSVLGITRTGFSVRFGNYPPHPMLTWGERAAFKPSPLNDNKIEQETKVYKYMNAKEELKDVVPKLLFSGFSSADPPSSVRSKKQVVCRMLVTTCHGRPRMTRWSEEAQAAVKAAYEKLWTAGVLHKAVADRNILFKDNVGSDEDVEVNNIRLCDFEDALLKHDLKPEKWASALEEERKALENLCERMGKAPLPEKKKKLFWTADDIRKAIAEGRNPFE